ncbi:MAG: hypothetical protein IJ801_09245, partial [Lachnospiraceae bacterium]|nr:hypothetical protein [Lachnospiraceae bacterium]
GQIVADREKQEAEWIYGWYGLEHRDPVLREYLRKEQSVLKAILGKLEQQGRRMGSENLPDKTRERMRTVQKELECNADALEYFRTT